MDPGGDEPKGCRAFVRISPIVTNFGIYVDSGCHEIRDMCPLGCHEWSRKCSGFVTGRKVSVSAVLSRICHEMVCHVVK